MGKISHLPSDLKGQHERFTLPVNGYHMHTESECVGSEQSGTKNITGSAKIYAEVRLICDIRVGIR